MVQLLVVPPGSLKGSTISVGALFCKNRQNEERRHFCEDDVIATLLNVEVWEFGLGRQSFGGSFPK